jgi:hypothetical protein
MEGQPGAREGELRERAIPDIGAPGFATWAHARHEIDSLREKAGGPRWLRRDSVAVVTADLELIPVSLDDMEPGWWNVADPTPLEREPLWLALRPAGHGARVVLAAGTRLVHVARTDPHWTRLQFQMREDALFDILDGPLAGQQCVAVQEGPSDAATGIAGQLITAPLDDPATFAARVLSSAAPLLALTSPLER